MSPASLTSQQSIHDKYCVTRQVQLRFMTENEIKSNIHVTHSYIRPRGPEHTTHIIWKTNYILQKNVL